MNPWPELWHRLFDEEQAFSKRAPRWILLAPEGRLVDRYEELIDEHHKAVETAIKQFARNRTWPALTPHQIAALRLRLNFAVYLAALFDQAKIQMPELRTDAARLKWLLIFAWENCGSANMTSSLASLLPEDTGANLPLTDHGGSLSGSM